MALFVPRLPTLINILQVTSSDRTNTLTINAVSCMTSVDSSSLAALL
jgi:hypothetical protein